ARLLEHEGQGVGMDWSEVRRIAMEVDGAREEGQRVRRLDDDDATGPKRRRREAEEPRLVCTGQVLHHMRAQDPVERALALVCEESEEAGGPDGSAGPPAGAHNPATRVDADRHDPRPTEEPEELAPAAPEISDPPTAREALEVAALPVADDLLRAPEAILEG